MKLTKSKNRKRNRWRSVYFASTYTLDLLYPLDTRVVLSTARPTQITAANVDQWPEARAWECNTASPVRQEVRSSRQPTRVFFWKSNDFSTLLVSRPPGANYIFILQKLFFSQSFSWQLEKVKIVLLSIIFFKNYYALYFTTILLKRTNKIETDS